ncbi:MAG TPA: LuxR C-terminal-related transcriptional regulator [Rhizobacter sp.]|nr:LuxR C-terminal-related transcriptional regulator [Rhizobacter sp.]
MLSTRFALTKIQPPRARPGLIARAGLEQRLIHSLENARLVLLCAPAGFGKTGLLTRALAALPPETGVAWVACDEDDDLHRVLDCLCNALEPFDLPWRVEPDAIVASASPERDALRRTADSLLNALAGSEHRGLIVLDDAHRLNDPAIFACCDLLLERLPPQWTLAVSTRVDPPLALPRLRARDELAEFRTEDLRLTEAEATLLVQQHAPGLDAVPLWERTQGWAAGLRLALNAGKPGRPAARAAADRHAFDYLVSEVLDALPEALRLFLLRSSVLPELTPTRCARVTGHTDAATLLEETEARGLFVSVLQGCDPGAETALKLHDLFRDCLEDRLQRERSAELPQLLALAAETETDPQRRIGYLLRGGLWPQAQAVLEQEAPRLIGEGAVEGVLRLIEQFPTAWRAQAPGLDFTDGIAAWARWSFSRMAESMLRGAEGYRRLGDTEGEQRCRVYHTAALCGQGHVQESSNQLDRLDPLPLPTEQRALASLLRTWHVLDNCRLGELPALYAKTIGLLEQADRADLWSRCQTLLPFVSAPGMGAVLARYLRGAKRHVGELPSTLRAGSLAIEACSLLWQGQFEPALRALEAAEQDHRWLGNPLSVAAFTRSARALWHAWRGEGEAALASSKGLLDDLDDPRSRDRRLLWRGYYQMFHARIALLVGDTDTVRLLQQRVPPQRGPLELKLLAHQRITLAAHVAALDGRWAEASAGYQAALQHEELLMVFGQHIETRLRLAQAELARDRTEAAVQALLPLLQTVQSDQESAPLMAGPQVLAELVRLGNALPSPLREQLARWHQRAQSLRGGPSASAAVAPSAPTHDKLSERELEVLERIAAGDSNKLIARAFDLSPHTVKRHVANVLDKLGLASRGQAAAWYREHAGPR